MKTSPLLLAAAAIFIQAIASGAAEQKPNILIILSDDQGYADTGFQGSTDIPTGPQESLSDGSRIYVAPGATLETLADCESRVLPLLSVAISA